MADRNIGEATKSNLRRELSGFYTRFMTGKGVDVGFKGQWADAVPVLQSAKGLELGTEGYDGIHLPYEDDSLDYVYSSHLLEHVDDYKAILRDWHRAVKPYGHIVIIVPHKFLYEKKNNPPSLFNGDHKRFYTPASLLAEIEQSLQPNSYRVRWLKDNDFNFDYRIAPPQHSNGCYEIECAIEKIPPPAWELQR